MYPRLKHIGVAALGLFLITFAAGSHLGMLTAVSRAEKPESADSEEEGGKHCFTTKIMAPCGDTGQGPELPCGTGTCLTYMEWTEGTMTECGKAVEGGGFEGCGVGDPCIYHYRSWVCDEGACVQEKIVDKDHRTREATGAPCPVRVVE